MPKQIAISNNKTQNRDTLFHYIDTNPNHKLYFQISWDKKPTKQTQQETRTDFEKR